MTTLREAAQQALEALELVTDLTNHDDEIYDAIDTLRAALVEDAMQKFTDVNQELEASLAEPVQEPVAGVVLNEEGRAALVEHGREEWHCVVRNARRLYAAPPQPPAEPGGCEHCNQPLYAAIKCRVCGRVTEPVQEPVAWIHTDPDKPRVKFLEWRENEPGYRGDWIKTPLYTTPQRKPLTEEKIRAIGESYTDEIWRDDGWSIDFARAVERAHGIGGEE